MWVLKDGKIYAPYEAPVIAHTLPRELFHVYFPLSLRQILLVTFSLPSREAHQQHRMAPSEPSLSFERHEIMHVGHIPGHYASKCTKTQLIEDLIKTNLWPGEDAQWSYYGIVSHEVNK
ncbi:hypothetical protein P7K49_011726 [Saguinus oedipus]|uniref:Uncharacterized protein n=1 Tax=Saguinus oedipus TaxID=9490 RepID=A0ABQ9VRI8_SAGOE|nr:hypothetical protein P7K49_011726 [Saguinus oedipus]